MVLAWSGGKDATYALSVLRNADVEVVELLTTVDERYDRSTMHGVRRSVHEYQAESVGVPLNVVSLPPEPSNDAYEAIMSDVIEQYRDRGIRRIVFADLYLEDVRAYREAQLDGTGVAGYWPLWGCDTADLVRDFINVGFEAIVVTVDGDVLDESFAGCVLDDRFLDDLPSHVDPCGENGEFHTFVRDGPLFETPVPVETAETITRTVGGGEFHYCDLRTSPEV